VKEKDTKTHQSRRVTLDEVTVEVLAEHKACCEQRAAVCGVAVDAKGFVFSTSPDGTQPLLPNTVSGRVSQLSKRLGLAVNLRDLRHYAATEMLTNGVDLRTTAGRLGHGGSTTLKVYTHFLPAPDLRAAQVLAKSLPPSTLGRESRVTVPTFQHGYPKQDMPITRPAPKHSPNRAACRPGQPRQSPAWASQSPAPNPSPAQRASRADGYRPAHHRRPAQRRCYLGCRVAHRRRRGSTMSTVAERSSAPQARELTAEEGRAYVDEISHRLLGMSGEEFRRAWEAGELNADDDDVLHVALLLPLGW
jgi:Phage integrase family